MVWKVRDKERAQRSITSDDKTLDDKTLHLIKVLNTLSIAHNPASGFIHPQRFSDYGIQIPNSNQFGSHTENNYRPESAKQFTLFKKLQNRRPIYVMLFEKNMMITSSVVELNLIITRNHFNPCDPCAEIDEVEFAMKFQLLPISLIRMSSIIENSTN